MENPFKIGDRVRAIQGGLGIHPDDVGKETIITDVSDKARNGIPSVMTRDYDSGAFGGWIDVRSFELIERIEWIELDPELKKAFIKQLIGSLYIDKELYQKINKLINK